jgi:hypothetical protein
MDPDLVRQQEEEEREFLALAMQKSKAATLPVSVETAGAVRVEAPIIFEAAAQSAPALQKTPNRRGRTAAHAAPAGRTVSPKLIQYSIMYGVGRFLAHATAGAMIGVAAGNLAHGYLQMSPERYPAVVFCAMGAFTFICALMAILQQDR